MSKITKEEKKAINKIVKDLTEGLEALRPTVLKSASRIMGKDINIHVLHGIIGGKNNEYADCIKNQYSNPNDFITEWLEGFKRVKGDDWGNGGHPLFHLIKDDDITKYLIMFLQRNFYRHIEERTRPKPIESLWNCWFGDKSIFWGLLIAPVKRGDAWTNDVSEIRKAKFSYWTIGHVMSTGLVDLENDELYTFSTLDELYRFIKGILKRLKSSDYEKQLYDKYIDYLKDSEDPLEEPFLIPELRYGGTAKAHKYRLDFTILNPHTMSFIGLEISPQSSHMSVSGITKGKQVEWNDDLKLQWGKEMRKRNDYFGDYGITTITFTDSELEDLDACFAQIEGHLSQRARKNKNTVESQLALIRNHKRPDQK